MQWLKSFFRPKPPATPRKGMTTQEIEEFIRNSIAKGERPPDSAVAQMMSRQPQRPRKKKG